MHNPSMRDNNPTNSSINSVFDTEQILSIIPDSKRYLAFLAKYLKPDRIKHSIEVTSVMADLVDIYSLDRCQALTAAVLHDAAHDFTDEQLLAYAGQAGIRINHPSEAHPLYIHGPVSAALIQAELGIDDRAVLDAIFTHSFMENGSDFHAPLSWCLRFSDMLAVSRTWKDFQHRLRPLAYSGQLHEAACMAMVFVVDLHRSLGNPVHPRLLEIREELTRKPLQIIK